MNLEYALALMISAVVALVVASAAWQRRLAPGATGLAATMLALAVWAFTYAVRWVQVDYALQIFWLDATYLGVVTAPTAMLIFTLQVIRRTRWLSRRMLILFAVEPVITLALIWTDRLHGLFYAGMRSTDAILNGGVWFWVNAVYSYGLLLIAAVLLVKELIHARTFYRRQLIVMLVGMLLPWIGDVFSLAKLSPFPHLDLTPFVFIASGLVFSYGLTRYRLLDMVPIARDRLVERMSDGLIVLDVQHRVIDINPAARQMLEVTDKVVGGLADEAFAGWPELVGAAYSTAEKKMDLQARPGQPREYEVTTTPLFGVHTRINGWMIVLHDITQRKKAEAELRNLSLTDELTGLYNRRGFMLLARQQLRLARRMHRGLCLVFGDMDGLKKINDTHGHAAGDRALQLVANVMKDDFRDVDISARLGGDEFVMLVFDGLDNTADSLEQRLCTALQERALQAGLDYPVSLSIGVAQYNPATPCTLLDLLAVADARMYAQKKRLYQPAVDEL